MRPVIMSTPSSSSKSAPTVRFSREVMYTGTVNERLFMVINAETLVLHSKPGLQPEISTRGKSRTRSSTED